MLFIFWKAQTQRCGAETRFQSKNKKHTITAMPTSNYITIDIKI